MQQDMMKRYLMFVAVSLLAFALRAEVKVTASAPQTVVQGDQFRLSYTVNTQDVSGFQAPLSDDFSVLIGPNQSRQSSFQMINGRTTQSSTITYTYILMAKTAGTFTIPAATVTSGGKQYRSNSLRIEVLPPDKTTGSASSGSGNSGGGRMRTQDIGENISGKDLFIAVTASKKQVYEQEAILLTYKVYSLVSLSQLMGDMPELDGFHTQELPLPQQKSLKMEHYNGRNYGTVVWRQYLLFPQRSGKLTIPSIDFQAVVVQQDRNIDPFDAFFGGMTTMREVKKTVVAPALTIQVDALPMPKPDNFSGAVGQFTMNSSLTPQDIKANDALTLRLTVEGKGNMKLMKAPIVKFPQDFETYDAKTTDETKVTGNGVSGKMIYDFLAVPRHAGNYTIPAAEFCYFDTQAKEYKVIRTDAYDISVAKGKNSGRSSDFTDREDVRLLASDIRYIRQGDVVLHRPGEFFFGTLACWLWYVVPLLLFGVLVAVFRKKAIENANVAKMRNKKAGKAATKRLKQAGVLLKKGEPAAFYEEVMRALWGYLSDKLGIPVAELSKDNAAERLFQHGVGQSVVDSFLEVLNECEFARYAPGDPTQTMDKIFKAAGEVISAMESAIKR